MTITVTQPATPGPIGQGITVYGSTDAAAVNLPWTVSIALSDSGAGLQATTGRQETGSTGFAVVLGYDLHAGIFEAVLNGLDVGHALDMSILILDNTPAIVDSATIPGWSHDPMTGLSGLLAQLTSSSGTLDEILAAVKRTYP